MGILPAALVLHELHASWPSWAWIAVCGLLWPHLAFLKSHHSPDPSTSELHNFVIDSALAATLLPIMHFNLLPSALLLTVTTADKLNTGIRGLWWRSLLGALAALVIAIGISGLHFDIHTSTPVLLACLPLTMIHTLVVSASSYQLIRKVQKNNQALDELRRRDSLTGLQSRSHWQEMADQQLQRHVAGHASTLLLIDVDSFKHINDTFGHIGGDDLLRGIAQVILDTLPPGSHAGRLGGDEFAVTLPLPVSAAQDIAERIRAGIAALHFPADPKLSGSVSIGLAAPTQDCHNLRAWMELADRALYQAKADGRNRTQVAESAI
ncbi:diguanylate cyclase [Thermomonas sp.]|uniref:sensor domain-containing diguanylate cyclase n=1 Tax=Thermomonas sp. TaxID=1971895 RepID=UPI0032207A16